PRTPLRTRVQFWWRRWESNPRPSRRAPRRGYPLRILPLPPGGGGNLEPSSSARTRPIGRLALQGGLIPPDRAHSGRFQMSGEPKLVRAAPLYYAGEYLPRNPLRTRVQSQLSSRNENGPELLGAILIS